MVKTPVWAFLTAGLLAPLPCLAQSADFTGYWRIIKAERANWIKTAPKTPDFLRTAVVISPGRILAQPALACENAVVEEDTIWFSAAFDGADNKAPRRLLEPFGHQEGGLKNLRVKCGNVQRDYHLTVYKDIMLLHDGYILTMRKHGDDPDGKNTPSIERREASFDCNRAKTIAEKLICEFPDALIADGELGQQFRQLQKTLGKASADSLLRSQRLFNEHVIKFCDTASYTIPDIDRQREPVACIIGQTQTRKELLSGLEVASAGALRIEPLLTSQSRVRTSRIAGIVTDVKGWITHDAVPVLTGAQKPVAEAFAQAVRRAFPAPLIAGRNDLNGVITRNYQVHSLTEKFLSLTCTQHVHAGTAVPDAQCAINLDLATGKPVGLSEIFEMSDEWKTSVSNILKKDLNQPERFDELKPDILTGQSGVIWSFGADKVNVTWQAGGGGPAESVDIPANLLAPFIRASSPWRP